MKIISLNACGGTLRAPLMDFIMREAPSTDVFCFQEMYHNDAGIAEKEGTRLNLYGEITSALPDFLGTFEAVVEGKNLDIPVAKPVNCGLAIFTKKLPFVAFGSVFVAGSYNTLIPEGSHVNWPTVLQYAEVAGPSGKFVFAHIHGLPYPGNKLDTPDRLAQSDAIVRWVRSQKHPTVLSGDFNLLHGTQSIAKIEEIPMRNLITEYGIKNTRPVSHLLRYPEQDRQFFADYAFVSPQIKVNSFSVPDIEISDHLPLILELA